MGIKFFTSLTTDSCTSQRIQGTRKRQESKQILEGRRDTPGNEIKKKRKKKKKAAGHNAGEKIKTLRTMKGKGKRMDKKDERTDSVLVLPYSLKVKVLSAFGTADTPSLALVSPAGSKTRSGRRGGHVDGTASLEVMGEPACLGGSICLISGSFQPGDLVGFDGSGFGIGNVRDGLERGYAGGARADAGWGRRHGGSQGE